MNLKKQKWMGNGLSLLLAYIYKQFFHFSFIHKWETCLDELKLFFLNLFGNIVVAEMPLQLLPRERVIAAKYVVALQGH